jgi:hypothetical protein
MNRRFAIFTISISLCLTSGITNSYSSENKAREVKAPCRLEVEYAHISTSIFEKSKQMAVKVNAFSICNVPSSNVQITVQIWKTGRLSPIKVQQSIAKYRGVVPAGKKFSNKDTYTKCKDRTPTYYYGVAYAKALIAGKWQYARQTLSKEPKLLMCGT